MKNRYKIHFLVFCLPVLLILSGCSPQQKLANLLNKYPELRRDSTYYRFTILDSIITSHALADTVFTQLPDSGETVSVTAGSARATLTNDSGKYKLLAEQLPDTIYINHTDSVAIPTYEFVEVVKDKPVPFIIKFLAVIGGIAIAAVAGRAAIRIFLKR